MPWVFVLLLFAVVAGAATALSPCVLPVLPALLSAGATGGRRRPMGIAVGLAITFTITIVGLATVVDGVGLGDSLLRDLAIAVLAAFGVALLVPRLAERLEAPLARLARLGPTTRGSGFWSGIGVGAALGFVYAPCAGPILAAVIAVSASQGASGSVVLVALAYAAGSAAVLLALAFGGRTLLERARAAGRGPVIQRVAGVVMIATAVAMAAGLDVRFQTAIADHLPAAVVNPAESLEESGAVRDRLADLRADPASRFTAAAPARRRAALRDLGPAPDFTGTQRWFNTPGGRPLTLASLRGRVVLVDFWTYTCINCLRTLPAVKALDRRYRDAGLTIVGVHTPEFGFEKDAGNVRAAIAQNRLRYPVAQDNAYGTWNAYGNQVWPAKYLLDARGHVRYVHFGEGNEAETEAAVRDLLDAAGATRLGRPAGVRGEQPGTTRATPETYLGAERAMGFTEAPRPGTHRYTAAGEDLPQNALSLGGTWSVGPQSATAVRDATVDLHFAARDVFLVLSSAGSRPRKVGVVLDGRPITARDAGADVRGGAMTVRGQRLYRVVRLPAAGDARLRLRLPPGVAAYAFTFG